MSGRDEFLDEMLPGGLGPGLYADVSHDAYHADPCATPSLSSSMARLIVDEAPLHVYSAHPHLGAAAPVNKRVYDRGTMIHLLLLGKGQDFVEIEADNYKTGAAQRAREGAYAEKKVPVLSRELEEYQAVAKIFRDKLAATVDDAGNPDPVVFDGESELTGVWEQAHLGAKVLCRLRADHFRPRNLEVYDVKSTIKSVSPRSIARELYANGADIQRAHYTKGLGQLVPNGEGRIRMRFLFLEMKPPYDVVVAEPNGEFDVLGERRWRRGVERWAAALANNYWPGHSAGRTLRIGPPKYALADDADGAAEAMGPPSRPEF